MSKNKILVVDDEENLCRSVKLNLEETGKYEVRTETQGSNALSAAQEFQPDLIILDFIMPDKDGSQVALELQSDAATKDIPIIFFTAIASREDTQEHGNLIGGNFVIAKPISTDKLVEAIETQIKQ